MFEMFYLKNGISNVGGFYCGGINAGLRQGSEQGDLAFIRTDMSCMTAAVYTENRFKAAPIRHALRYGRVFENNFILINAKNANAMTGEEGIADIEKILARIPEELKPVNPIMSSTGVIGYRLPVDMIIGSMNRFDWKARESDKAAMSILTTDKFKKEICIEVELENGNSFRIAAIAKGAGMINPAMATMLCFIVTDADVPAADMQRLLGVAVKDSFNAISVDGDRSTNDSVFLMSNGASGIYDETAFLEALKQLCFEISMQILRDGEGATKLVAFEVRGAASDREAEIAARNLSNSLLVKTALFGEDPNWGRIASTIGSSGIECSEESLSIYYDDLLVYDRDHSELDKEREAMACRIMEKESFRVVCDLGLGSGKYTAYGCDLSYEYVKINAEYRT